MKNFRLGLRNDRGADSERCVRLCQMALHLNFAISKACNSGDIVFRRIISWLSDGWIFVVVVLFGSLENVLQGS